MIDRASVGSLTAVIVEPILSDGGMLTLPKGYLKRLKQCCEERQMLLIVDEAQTAMGRCGTMFAFEQEGVKPDILTLCKGFGNGFPVSAVVTTKEIEERSHDKGFFYYATHANDPMAAAVALQVLTVVERDSLAQRATEAGNRLRAGLERLKTKYGCIGDVRGRGLLVGLEVVRDPESKESDPETAEKLVSAITEDGLSIHLATLTNGGRAFRIAPSLVISDDEIDEGLSIMEGAFERVCYQGTSTRYVNSVSARA
jgi:4-aminobutyrate aminotransferase-like enzyme